MLTNLDGTCATSFPVAHPQENTYNYVKPTLMLLCSHEALLTELQI